MKLTTLLLICFVLVSSFCSRQLPIPEVSPYINTIKLFELTASDPQPTLLKHDKNLVFFTAKGEVIRLDPGTKSEKVLHRFNKPLRPALFHQKNRVLLEFADQSAYIVLDLTNGQSVKISSSTSIHRCLAIGEDIIVYQKKNTLHFLNYRTGKELKQRKTKKSLIFNTLWLENKLLILSSRYLYTYHPQTNQLDNFRLPNRPSSPFLYQQDSIYYGNTARELVKISLTTNKVKWRHKISKIIKVQPNWINQHIVVLSEDNNIYFFTSTGSLEWWQKLETQRLSAPMVMGDNIGILLRPAQRPTINFLIAWKKVWSVLSWTKRYPGIASHFTTGMPSISSFRKMRNNPSTSQQ